jgi:hypothetical protein
MHSGMQLSGPTRAYWVSVKRTNVKHGTRNAVKNVVPARAKIQKEKRKKNGREKERLMMKRRRVKLV